MNAVLTLKIADIMSRSICSVSDDATLNDAAQKMAQAGISSLLVMSGQTLLGIITERDLLRMLDMPADVKTPVGEVMSSPVISVSPDTDFDEAFSIALNHHVRHLVVVNEAGAVVGIVSDTDFRTHLDMSALRQLDELEVIMDRDLPILVADSNLTDALHLMLRDHSSYVLVVENDCPAGILTERDIPKLMANVMSEGSKRLTLREVMQKPVQTVPNNTSVFELVNFMQARQLRHIVVVDEAGKTLGMVTQRKLLERLLVFLMRDKELHLKRIKHLSDELLNQAAEASKLGFWEFDPFTRKLRGSGTLLQELGLASAIEAAPIALQEWIERTHPDDRSSFVAGWDAIQQQDNPMIELEFRITHQDNRWVWIQIKGRTIQSDAEGKPKLAVGTAMNITERKQSEEALRIMERERISHLQRLEEASRHLVAAQEEARRRLSGELHDRTSPNLAAIAINLDLLATELSREHSTDVAERLEDTRALIEDTATSIREICADLRPPLLDYAGLCPALEGYAQQFSRRTGIAVQLECANRDMRHAPDLESMLFRIFQEALTNCAKHARATSVRVTLNHGGRPIVLTVADNGSGFDPEQLGKAGRPGLGLINMREMAEVADGGFTIESAPGKGTCIRVEI